MPIEDSSPPKGYAQSAMENFIGPAIIIVFLALYYVVLPLAGVPT